MYRPTANKDLQLWAGLQEWVRPSERPRTRKVVVGGLVHTVPARRADAEWYINNQIAPSLRPEAWAAWERAK